MIGFLIGLVRNMMFVGYSIVEAFVLMLAFNNLAPFIHENAFCLPFINIGYWQTVSVLIVMSFLGKFIQKINPFKFEVKHEHTKDD
jgi:hypothetical protein